MAGLVGGLLVPVHGQQAERRLPVPPTTLRSSASFSLRRVSLFNVSFFETVFFMNVLSRFVRNELRDSGDRRRIILRTHLCHALCKRITELFGECCFYKRRRSKSSKITICDRATSADLPGSCRRSSFRRQLRRNQSVIYALAIHQLAMRSALDDLPGFHHQDQVCLHDRAEPVSDHDARA